MEKFILWDTLYKDAAIQFFVSIIPSFFSNLKLPVNSFINVSLNIVEPTGPGLQ